MSHTKMFAIHRTDNYLTADWLKSFKSRKASGDISRIILRKNKYGCALVSTIFIKFGMSLCGILLTYNFYWLLLFKVFKYRIFQNFLYVVDNVIEWWNERKWEIHLFLEKLGKKMWQSEKRIIRMCDSYRLLSKSRDAFSGYNQTNLLLTFSFL